MVHGFEVYLGDSTMTFQTQTSAIVEQSKSNWMTRKLICRLKITKGLLESLKASEHLRVSSNDITKLR
jgi:hypothetical protein